MAINTRDRRSSCIGIDLLFVHVWPNPDGAIADQDRQHIGLVYRGISTIASTLMAMERSIARRVHGRLFGRINRRDAAIPMAERGR